MKILRTLPYHQHCLPPIKASIFDPTRSSLSRSEQIERWLLTLDDEHFNAVTEKNIDILDDAPTKTGDAIVDQWEREYWEREKWHSKAVN